MPGSLIPKQYPNLLPYSATVLMQKIIIIIGILM